MPFRGDIGSYVKQPRTKTYGEKIANAAVDPSSFGLHDQAGFVPQTASTVDEGDCSVCTEKKKKKKSAASVDLDNNLFTDHGLGVGHCGMIRSPDVAGTVIIMIGPDALYYLSFAVIFKLLSSTSAHSTWGGGQNGSRSTIRLPS